MDGRGQALGQGPPAITPSGNPTMSSESLADVPRLTTCRRGMLSLATALFIIGLNLALILVGLYVQRTARSAQPVLAYAHAVGGVDFFAWLLSLFGLVQGVIGLVQREEKRKLAIWGVALNGVIFFGVVAASLLFGR